MPIAQIIDEIDAYLFLLRQARDLLLGPGKGATHLKRSVRANKKVGVTTKATHQTPGKPRILAGKSRSAQQRPKRAKGDGRANPVAEVLGPGPQQPVRQKLPPTVATGIPVRQVNKDGLLPIAPTVLKSRVRRMAARPAIIRKPKGAAAIKPAIAVAASVHSKIVVVSAEQLQREREKATRPPAQRPRIPASGLSGRRAFEALFKNDSDSSNNSGQ